MGNRNNSMLNASSSAAANAARLIALPVALAAAGWSAPALAQQTAGAAALEEVVVTARRKEEQIQTVPVAITAMTGEQLVARNVQKPSDLMSSVPGVFAAPGSNRGTNAPVFAIRGQLNRDPTPTNDPSIGLYFAEVPWARVQGSNAAFFDLQSVQVLKGPQGTLFGRNSTAGAILITPNAPSDEFGGHVKLTAGDYKLFGAEAVVNLPVNDQLAIRIAGNHEQRSGYLTAVTSGQHLNDVNNYSLRVSAKWTPTDAFSSTVIGNFFTSRANADGARLIGVAPAPPSAAVAALYPRFVDALRRISVLDKYAILTQYSPTVASTQVLGVPSVFGTRHFANVRTWSLQNTSEWRLGELGFLGDVTLKNIVSYRREADSNTFDTVSVDFLNVQSVSEQEIHQVTEEFQLQGETGPLDYIVGLFYFRESGHDRSTSYAVAPIFGIIDNKVTNTSYSVFAHANYDLSSLVTPGLSLSGGVRFNNDKRFWNGKNRRQTTPGPSLSPLYTCPLQTAIPPNDGSLCRFPNSITFREPTWDIGLNYKLSDNSFLYASVGRGYRSGGYNQSAGSAAAAAPFLPEKVLTYEIGAKNDFTLGEAVGRLNLAAFYTDYSDIQRTVNIVQPNGTLGNLTINAAKAHISGAEAELTLKPTRRLEFTLSYSYLSPKYDKFTDLYAETNPAFLPPGVSRVLYPIDVSDSQFILVSKHSVNATVSYTLPVDEAFGEPTLRATYYYRTGFYTTSDINTANCRVPGNPNPAAIYTNCYNHGGRLPGYGLLNLRLDWRNVMGRGFDGSLFVNNATNKYYYNNALNALGAFGAISAQIGAPRMFGASLTVPFGR